MKSEIWMCLFMTLLCSVLTVCAVRSGATGGSALLGLATGLWLGNLIREVQTK